MSSSSDTARRLSQHIPPDQAETGKQTESRRGSRYEIYGTATRPFGESYRKSLLLQREQADEQRDSPVDTDSVEETMGCSTSRTEVAVNEETVKGSFIHKDIKDPQPMSKVKINGVVKKTVNNNIDIPPGLSDFELVYGHDKVNNIVLEHQNGYSTTDIYAEVKKPQKHEKELKHSNETESQTPREKLMQQIRNRKEEPNNKENGKENAYSTVANIDKPCEEKINKQTTNTMNENILHNINDKISTPIVNSEPVSFVEEEYSYEPDKKESISKLVVRSRSLINIEHNQSNNNNTYTMKRPNTLKMTTKPDGTIRYGLRKGSSESDLLNDDSELVSSQSSETKSNYVNSIKSAFDAAIESQNKEEKTERAEAFDGLRQYFHDNKHGLQELLINNNVVIIEPFRPDPPRSPSDKSDSSSQRTCRITGATIKSPLSGQNKTIKSSNTLPRRHIKCRQNTKQGFYHPIKVNKELIDAELPDPDKVKNAREMFEKVFKSRSNIEMPLQKPQSKSFFNTICGKLRITPEVKVVQEGKQTSQDRRRQGRLLIEQAMREDVKRYPLQRRWTDSGSLSSGVSSDYSCDQDCEFHGSNSGSNQEILEEYSSADEDAEYIYPYDDDERHPVSSEVLQKIRACGTTVTYYGGRVISRSNGQFRSPMTMTIMDEIRQNEGTTEGRKQFESGEEPYLGVKFRLVKSNSCGSRLEIAGTEEDCGPKLTSPHHESFWGKSIAEEVTEVQNEQQNKNSENETNIEEEEKAEADRYGSNIDLPVTKNPPVMTWAELKLKEARKQWHCTAEAVRLPPQDMEFETFEVLDESQPHKPEKDETSRG